MTDLTAVKHFWESHINNEYYTDADRGSAAYFAEIEARRYRHLHHSKWRLWLMEIGYFREFLSPPKTSDFEWHCILAEDLKKPTLLITWLAAARVRLRRNYLLLLYFITAVWVTKLYIHPHRPDSVGELLARSAVGDMIPSWFVAITAPIFVIGATVLAGTCPSGEDLEDWSEELRPGGS